MGKPAEPDEKAEVKLCSKCGEHPRAQPNGTNPWCQKCLSQYMAGYHERKEERARRAGFITGVAAMRSAVAWLFSNYRNAQFSGAEVAVQVEQIPSPAVPEEEAPPAGVPLDQTP